MEQKENKKTSAIKKVLSAYLKPWVVVAFAYTITFHYYNNWKGGLSGGDPLGYYFWAASTLVHHDLTDPVHSLKAFQKAFDRPSTNYTDYGFHHPPNAKEGVYVNKYTMGLSLLNAPFIVTAHWLAKPLGYEPSGFSRIYRYFFFLAGLVYGIVGLYFLEKSLRRFFESKVVWVTLLAIGLATNLFFFAAWSSGMSHPASFMLFALLLYGTIQFYERPSWRSALQIGFSYGMICLIRPTDMIVITLPLLYGLVSWKAVKDRLWLWGREWPKILLAIGATLLVGFPQLLFWKIHTGQWLYYSYGEEGFDFSNPHIREGLLGFQNGWLIYTPVMFLALLGAPLLLKYRALLWPICIAVPIQIFVIYSYWCWQWNNGFGARPMVQFYVLLAFPLAYLLRSALSKWVLAVPVLGAVAFCTALNLSHTWQFIQGMMCGELGQKQFYLSTLFKTKLDSNDLLYFDGIPKQPDDVSKLKLVKTLCTNNFEDSSGVHYTDRAHQGRSAMICKQGKEFSPGYILDHAGEHLHKGQWLRISVWALSPKGLNGIYSMANLVTSFSNDGVAEPYHSARIENKLGNLENTIWSKVPGVWGQVAYYVPVPENIKGDTRLGIYVWNPHSTEVLLDEFTVELYE